MTEREPPRFRASHLTELDADVLFGDGFIVRGGERGLMVVHLRDNVGCDSVRLSLWHTDSKFQSWLQALCDRFKLLRAEAK